MSCSDDNPCFDIGTPEGASGVQENSTAVSAMQIQRLYWSMLKISVFNKLLLMNFKLRDFGAREAPPFMAGSSHLSSQSSRKEIKYRMYENLADTDIEHQ